MLKQKEHTISSSNLYVTIIFISVVITFLSLALLLVEVQYTKTTFSIISSILVLFSVVVILKNPVIVKDVFKVYGNSIETNSWEIKFEAIDSVIKITPFQKILLLLLLGKNVYSNYVFSSGYLFKLKNGESYVTDIFKLPDGLKPFASPMEKMMPAFKDKLLILIVILLILSSQWFLVYFAYLNVIYGAAALLFMFFIINELLRKYFITFFLSSDIKLPDLPIDQSLFKGIKVKRGLIVGEKTQFAIIHGIAINLLFKKILILSPSIFKCPDKNIVQYLMYHELGHLKMNHGVINTFLTPLLLILIIVSSFLPPIAFPAHWPSYTGLLIIIIVFLIAWNIRKKNIENEINADFYAAGIMGVDNVIRAIKVLERNNESLFNKHWLYSLISYLSPEKRVMKLEKMRDKNVKFK